MRRAILALTLLAVTSAQALTCSTDAWRWEDSARAAIHAGLVIADVSQSIGANDSPATGFSESNIVLVNLFGTKYPSKAEFAFAGATAIMGGIGIAQCLDVGYRDVFQATIIGIEIMTYQGNAALGLRAKF